MFVLSHQPHQRRHGRAAAEPLAAALALVPPALAAAYLWPARFPLVLLAALASGLGVALAMGRGRVSKPDAGWCLFEALALALVMPASVAWYFPALMLAVVVFVRTLITDRDFMPPLNMPAMVLGMAVLFASPEGLAASFGTAVAGRGITKGNFFFITGWIPLAAAVLITIALRFRAFKWSMAGWFLLSAGLAAGIWGWLSGIAVQPGWALLPLYAGIFAAITLIIDPRSTPLSARGQTGAGSIAGIVFALFVISGRCCQGMIISALTANLVTPLFDYLQARSPARE